MTLVYSSTIIPKVEGTQGHAGRLVSTAGALKGDLLSRSSQGSGLHRGGSAWLRDVSATGCSSLPFSGTSPPGSVLPLSDQARQQLPSELTVQSRWTAGNF